MPLSNVIEKLGRAIFEAPFGAHRLAKDAPELAEVRLAVLDAVKSKSHRLGGKNVFPYDLVRIQLRGVPEEQTAMFRGEFLSAYFAEELKSGLARSSYRFPAALSVEILTTTKLPEPGEDWLTVETAMRNGEAGALSSGTLARLRVVAGTTASPELLLDKARTNVGRTAEVFNASGPSRRNDLAFTGDAEADASVSREHAHILFSKATGEYRLLNDRLYKGDANCGLWIVRDGLSQPVHHGTRGTLLKSGDEIHLGSARVIFSIE